MDYLAAPPAPIRVEESDVIRLAAIGNRRAHAPSRVSALGGALVLCGALALGGLSPSIAAAGGAPALHVQELAAKGVPSTGPYLRAINRRGPMLATCYGSREALDAAQPFEAFIEVGKSGTPQLVNLQAVREGASPELDACLLMQLDKVRFPEGKRVIELSILLGPAPVLDETPAED